MTSLAAPQNARGWTVYGIRGLLLIALAVTVVMLFKTAAHPYQFLISIVVVLLGIYGVINFGEVRSDVE